MQQPGLLEHPDFTLVGSAASGEVEFARPDKIWAVTTRSSFKVRRCALQANDMRLLKMSSEQTKSMFTQTVEETFTTASMIDYWFSPTS